MDVWILDRLARELSRELGQVRLLSLREDTSWRVVLRFGVDADSRPHDLTISLANPEPWIGRAPRRWPGRERSLTEFSRALLALRGVTVEDVVRLPGDRVIRIDLEASVDIVIDMLPSRADALVVERKTRKIIASFRGRNVGERFEPRPPGPVDVMAAGVDALVAHLLAEGIEPGSPERAVRRALRGLGRDTVVSLLEAAGPGRGTGTAGGGSRRATRGGRAASAGTLPDPDAGAEARTLHARARCRRRGPLLASVGAQGGAAR